MAAAVMGDDAVALVEEEEHLGVPVIGAERPPVMEDDRLAGAPVLVEDLRCRPGCVIVLLLMVSLLFEDCFTETEACAV